jgi:hypothetical protein
MSQTRTLRITFDLEDPVPTPPPEDDLLKDLSGLGRFTPEEADRLDAVYRERDAAYAETARAERARDTALAAQALAEQAMEIQSGIGTKAEQARDAAWARLRELEPYVQQLEFERQRYFELAGLLGRALQRFGDHEAGCVEASPVNGADGCTCGYGAAVAAAGSVGTV